ncbi:MAG: CatB-related O-acetyltransferase [Azoarcus sp.]|jgi:acetyltransferase-like isoleucine patch superfamily enzyme|nr:CatB-related O-acetyltransferase [Azoarcus sp.]
MAQRVAAVLLAQGHTVRGFIDENALDPDEGKMMVVRGIAGAPAQGLVVLQPRTWASSDNLANYIVVVTPAGNSVGDIEESISREEEILNYDVRWAINFAEICHIYPECGIRKTSWFQICRNKRILLKTYPNVSMGFMSYVSSIPRIYNFLGDAEARLDIGSFSSIAHNVQIVVDGAGHGSHGKDWVTTFPVRALNETAHFPSPQEKKSVTIGSDVWIGMDTMILSGVNIGHGAIVAACSVVSRDVEPYAVVAGNPARHKRYRFPQREREALLQASWWDWPWEEIQQVFPMLFSSRIEDFLRYAAMRPGAPRHGALADFAAAGN